MKTITAYPEITVIRPSGSFNASNAAEFQSDIVKVVTATKHSSVLVDLEQVEFMDSAALMALVRGLRLAQSLGKSFSLCSVSPSIQIIFELTQLDRVFEIFDSEATFALAIALSQKLMK
ncbi:MAG TPA: anti-anti-sigma factor [Cyanobacteria bacterium UBA11049]|nr:anti-anti-sigma factor [Cyanobacteria bacterium UBA11049]